jgi:integrase
LATIKKRILPSGLIRWQVDFADAGGKRRAKLFERRREADQFLVKVRPQVLAGTYIHDSVSITVGEAADAWLVHCRVRRDARRRMERTTYVGYEGYVRCHIKDGKVGIGDLKLSRLSRKAVNDFRDRLLTSDRSEMITRKILGALRLVLNHAIDNGQVHANAAQGVRVLRSSRLDYKVSVPAKQDVKSLIDGLTGRLRAMLVVSALCGLRASETRGLRWADVDLANGFLHVR